MSISLNGTGDQRRLGTNVIRISKELGDTKVHPDDVFGARDPHLKLLAKAA